MACVNGFIVVTSAYKIRIRTDSADNNALMLLDNGELVALLVELADESHGDARGRWAIEAIFGLSPSRHPEAFNSASDAARWIGRYICHKPFELSDDVVELS
jgi:hypothetical protein